jgi:hypothetical protein
MANQRGFAMGVAIGLREDITAVQLRALAKPSRDAAQTPRLLALAAIGDGGSRSAAAKVGGVGLQTVRDRVLAFNAAGNAAGPPGLIDGKGARQSPAARCRQAPSAGADRRGGAAPGGARGGAPAARRSATMGVRPLRDCDQQADAEPPIARPWLWQTVGPAAPPCPGRRRRRDVQKNFAASLDAICPARAAAAGLVLPRCNIAAMALHLTELSPAVKPGAPAVLLLDQAGWHLSDKLTVPDNITLMPLPPIARAEPGREPLAVHARQSALEPQLPIRRGVARCRRASCVICR